MEIRRAGSQASGKGPSDWFTGTVRIDPLFPAVAPARAAGNAVTFEPGARTAWHTHPLGQTLIVTAGAGRVQRWGGPIEDIRPGDVVWFEPGESTGTARPRRRPWPTLLSGKLWTGRRYNGWSTSATSNTAGES
jgi:quercetin dioxygenase-like cupin family protein